MSEVLYDQDLTSLRPENLSIRTLYKFRSWDLAVDPHGQDILRNNILYFSSVIDFNDPLEGKIPLRYDLASSDYILNGMLNTVNDAYPELTHEEQISLCHTYVAQEVNRDPDELSRQSKDHHQYCADNYGIASLSEELDNVVLWSHYADMHRGYCIGLNVRALLEHRHALASRSSLVIDLYKVRYLNRMPVLIPSELSTEEFSILPLTSKSNDWIYEKEYRLISIDGRGEMGFPDNFISKVVLGYDMNQHDKDEIIQILAGKGHRIDLFETYLIDQSFNLDFKKLEY